MNFMSFQDFCQNSPSTSYLIIFENGQLLNNSSSVGITFHNRPFRLSIKRG